MQAYFKGKSIFGLQGPAGPDGNPIGTIISYMGTSAPEDYLVCDGTEYNISEYPALADFFRQQFGSANHFGGYGESTFAVPDMRNLFLRGYHCEAVEQLSGEIGEKQDATRHPYFYGPEQGTYGCISYGNAIKNALNFPENIDDATSSNQYAQIISSRSTPNWMDRTDIDAEHGKVFNDYTSRPVNMAVLYCIKASGGQSSQNTYSTEEQRIGTWIDGKPLYQVTIVTQHSSIANNTWVNSSSIQNMDYGMIDSGQIKEEGASKRLDLQSSLFRLAIGENGLVQFYTENFSATRSVSWITVKYTKTID